MADYWSTLDVDLHLPVDSGTGRRNGLEHALREAIRDGRLSAGTRLPSTRTLAAELGVSRGTVSAAYDQLVAEGHLLAQRGSGTRVAHTAGAVAASRSVDRGPASPVPMRHDLRSGRTDLSRFPTAAWLRASRAALGRATRDAFGYGDPRGRIELRSALAEYLGRTRGCWRHRIGSSSPRACSRAWDCSAACCRPPAYRRWPWRIPTSRSSRRGPEAGSDRRALARG